jgi:uncharacterized protein
MAEPACGTVAIVGASARAAAHAALRAGLSVVAADLFADADLARHVQVTRIARYPFDLSPWLRAQRATGWLYTGALENYPRLVDEMAQFAPLWGNAGRALRAVRSPWRLADCLRSANLLFPELARTDSSVPSDGTWLHKPLRGSNGAGIELWLGQQKSSRQRMFLQRRVPGTPCAALFVVANKSARLLGVTRQLVGEPWASAKPFQYAGTLGPWPITTSHHEQITQIGNTLAGDFTLHGLFGVDLMIDGENVWTIEVNPRYTAAAEVVERSIGVNSIAAHVAACRDGTLPEAIALPPLGRCYGKAILYALRDATVSNEFHDWAIAQSGPALDATLADIPADGTRLRAGYPVLTVLASGATLAMVETELKTRIEEARLLLYCERRG